MPKMKTHSGAAKRFKVTGSGKIMRRKEGHRHILTSKNRSRKRNLKGETVLYPGDATRTAPLLPYRKS